jgi:hypothetical protein
MSLQLSSATGEIVQMTKPIKCKTLCYVKASYMMLSLGVLRLIYYPEVQALGL